MDPNRAFLPLVLAAAGLVALASGAARAGSFSDREAILPFEPSHLEAPNPIAGAPPLDVYYEVPRDARGVVYLFHGGGGSTRSWLGRTEEAALLGDLVRRGFGIVVTESTHRSRQAGNKRNWIGVTPDLPMPPGVLARTVNADEMHIRRVHRYLTDRGVYQPWTTAAPGTPIYFAGFSSGGKFASVLGYLAKLSPPRSLDFAGRRTDDPASTDRMNVKAVAIYCTTGRSYYFGNLPGHAPLVPAWDTPVIFNYGANDKKNDPADIEANAAHIAGLGVDVATHRSEPLALRADRFTRVIGVSFTTSRTIYETLLDRGHLDADGLVQMRTNPKATIAGLARRGVVTGAQADECRRQLSVLDAQHAVMARYHHRTVSFFEAHP